MGGNVGIGRAAAKQASIARQANHPNTNLPAGISTGFELLMRFSFLANRTIRETSRERERAMTELSEMLNPQSSVQMAWVRIRADWGTRGGRAGVDERGAFSIHSVYLGRILYLFKGCFVYLSNC